MTNIPIYDIFVLFFGEGSKEKVKKMSKMTDKQTTLLKSFNDGDEIRIVGDIYGNWSGKKKIVVHNIGQKTIDPDVFSNVVKAFIVKLKEIGMIVGKDELIAHSLHSITVKRFKKVEKDVDIFNNI